MNIRKYTSSLTTAFSMAASSLLLAALYVAEVAANPVQEAQQGANSSGGSGGPSVAEVIRTVTNILIFLVGAASVIMIIVGAIRYVTSNGDESQVKAAKNTILYSVVGIILALAAYGIVDFVLGAF